MIEKINAMMAEIEALKANNAEDIEALRIKYLSKKGEITGLMAEFRNVAADQKRELGQKLNALKAAATEKIEALKAEYQSEDHIDTNIDLTRPAYPDEVGTRHPLSLVRQEIVDIFARMGFSIAEGPEVEDDWHVYGALNFADDHPARDMQDTFFVQQDPIVVLRSHTSSVQVRVMNQQKPPIRVVCPGRVYRNEAISARAHCFFHQVRDVWSKYPDSSSSKLLPIHRTIG